VEAKPMTVKELIDQLKQFPSDYVVSYEGGDYKDDYREVNTVEVSHRSTLGTPRGVYLK
jgi:sulfur carrier protein ThiS